MQRRRQRQQGAVQLGGLQVVLQDHCRLHELFTMSHSGSGLPKWLPSQAANSSTGLLS